MNKNLHISNLLQTILLGTCVVLGTGAAYYVEKEGNDTGDGSVTNPWQTVGHALSESSSGDTINIGAGEFREFLLITNPVTLKGQNIYTAGNPPLKRHESITEVRASAPAPGGAVITVMTNNVTIQDLTVYGDPDTNAVGSVLRGIYTAHRPLNVINCKIANIYGHGIEARGTEPPPSTTDNDSFRSYFAYNLITNISHSNDAIGVYLERTQATVERNEISGVNGSNALAGIFVSLCNYTANMSDPITVRSNFLNDCVQAVWANNPVASGEKILISGNTITNSIIGVRVQSSEGQAIINSNTIHVTGFTPNKGVPARGIWVHGDRDPWSVASATDHAVSYNTLISEATTNDGSIGMYFSYKTQPSESDNNGVRATVLTNYIYFFAIGTLVESGTTGISITNDPLVEVEYHYNDIYGSITSAIMTTGFTYMVDAMTNFLGYADPSNMVSTNVNYTGWTLGSWSLDTDGDGWNDWQDPDDDGDGMKDLDEIVAGTDPLDASSVLALNDFNWTATSGAAFEWPSATGRTYYVYRTTNLIQGFGAYITNVTASPPTNYYTDTSAPGATCFYRISVTN